YLFVRYLNAADNNQPHRTLASFPKLTQSRPSTQCSREQIVSTDLSTARGFTKQFTGYTQHTHKSYTRNPQIYPQPHPKTIPSTGYPKVIQALSTTSEYPVS